MRAREWTATAAYLYVLHLRPSELAWEYLRRNPAYRNEWDTGALSAPSPQHWGLQFRN